MKTVEPTPDKEAEFLANADSDSPIVMINLLRYRDQAQYPAGSDAKPCSGREAYSTYGASVVPMIVKHGGRPIWMGKATSSVIAPDEETWDDAVLVEYPSPKAFIDMISSDEYQAAAIHRTAGLDDSRLIATKTLMNAFTGAGD